MAFITTAFTYLIIFITSIIVAIRLWFKYNEFKLKRQYARQHLKYVKVPNTMVQAYWGRRPELIELDAVRKNGKVFGTDLFGTKTIFVADPDLVGVILSKEFFNFTNKRRIEIEDFQAFLTVASDEKWKRLRSIITPTFSTGKLKLMKPRIDDSAITLMKNIDAAVVKSNVLNIKEFFGNYTMDAIMQVAFGVKSDSHSDPENKIVNTAKLLFSKDVSFAEMTVLSIVFAIPGVLALMSKASAKASDDIVGFFKSFSMKIISEKQEKLQKLKEEGKESGKANNFLEMLLETEREFKNKKEGEKKDISESKNQDLDNKKPNKYITTDEIIAQVVLFFLSAYDTTATAISLTTYLLALHPKVQDKLHTEIDQFLQNLYHQNLHQDQDQEYSISKALLLVTFDSLAQLPYLNAVLSESLRLYPPGTFTERMVSKDLLVQTEDGEKQFEVKAGDIIRIPIYALHMDEEQWPSASTFDPSRFLSGSSDLATYHKYAYLPFSQGPRNCVARSLALYESKIALLHLFANYQVKTCAETDIPVKFYNNGQVLTPRDIRLKLEKR